MDYEKLTEESLDAIMKEIRIANGMEDRKDACSNGLVATANNKLEKDYELDFMKVHLNKAVIGTQIGLNKAPMTLQKGVKRVVAKAIEKIFLRVAQLITRDIREFNSETLFIFQSIKRKLEIMESNELILQTRIENLERENSKFIELEKKYSDLENSIELERKRVRSLENKIITVEQDNLKTIQKILEDIEETENIKTKNIELVEEALNNMKEESTLKAQDIENCITKLVERLNNNEIIMRRLNEKIININGITKWVNSRELAPVVSGELAEGVVDNSVFYHDFEEQFRGTREDIKERLKIYIPILEEYMDEWTNKKFIDIGCGRGEWLDLLKEKKVMEYVGVDLNQIQLNICEEYGHENLVQEDCIKYIKNIEDSSIDVITGFQIIEHLPTESLLLLLRECNRVLKHGGIILFETPNVSNLIVGATYFYTDPTHEKPLLKDVMKFYVERTGFREVQIIEANPARFSKKLMLPICFDGNQNLWNENIELLNTLLYGAQDYAVMGVKM